MAVKALSTLIGSRHELGEIIRSKATSLDDGRSLIACDGEITVSKPLLDAVLADGIHIAQPTLVKDSSDVKALRAEYFDMSDTNDIFIGISAEANSELEHFDDGGTRAAATITGFASAVAINAAGTQSYVVDVETTSFDLEILHNITSGIPNVAKDIDTSVDYDAGSLACLISNNGEVCKIFAQDTADDIHIWTSTDGPDGTWSEITQINPAAAVTRAISSHFARGNSDLSDMVIPTDKGLWISDDTGATWTEDILLPSGQQAFNVAITEAGIIYAVDVASTNRLYKTTDKGTTWTVLFELGRQERGDSEPMSQKNLQVSQVEVDSSDNIYLLGFQQPTATGASKAVISLWYSSDGGVTWAYSTLVYPLQPDGTGAVPMPTVSKEFRVNAAGTRMAWAVNTATDVDNIYLSVLTKGKFPPNIRSGYWKMVAD